MVLNRPIAMALCDNKDSQEPPQTFTFPTDNTKDSRSFEGYNFDMSAPCRRVVYHPLRDLGYKPEPNSEIYAYGLPSDTTDLELMEFFQQCGEIFKLKVMVGSGNANRGFCFVTFMNSEVAKSSLDLNYVPFRPHCYLRITLSYNNCRIFLGNIPLCKSRDDVWKELMKNGVTKITDVIMYRNYADRSQNRGFVFVEFEGHEQAAGFRAQYEGQLWMWGKEIIIDWSVPLPIVDSSVLEKVTTIFMRNLPVTLSKEELQESVFKLMDKENIQRVYKFKNYAFIHLFTRTQAEHLMKILKEHFDDELIQIEWAKPPSKQTSPSYRSQKVNQITSNMSRNLKLSLPASLSLESQEDDTRQTNSSAMKKKALSNDVELPSDVHVSRNLLRHRHGESYLNTALFTTARTPNDLTISLPQFSRYDWSTKDKDVFTLKNANLNKEAINTYKQRMEEHYGNGNLSNISEDKINCCELCSNLDKLLPKAT
ncbi:unnamed protein product [Diabrotica balteata]|uniref:RRM domain-containing protein n=1 Tax=Diabrotica balteata TaxID=107213 RepID=A0A9N9XL71_DIABA|nr:unnamed protein product [Diabrotica balteata]